MSLFSGSTGKASSASSVYSDDTPHYTRTLAVTTSAPSGSYKANVRPGGGRGGAGYYNKAKSPKAPKASLANEEWDDSAVLHKDQLLTPQLTTSFRKLGKKKMQGSIHSNETAREQGRPSTPLPEGMYPIGVSFLDMGG
ncbi:uncharacterized protein EHS24_008498 [Apiotrichum porosum]|uniref:Uncharacterized protein n=1 Tax=Apiotrichum porosum TaxID=105984 RepID=A0A427XQD0_9TREE|nr:uncharacterized protein EHS24_008498 [Apiotrichum porosum]RSH81064.1 hypothetical protein EHS24_008498 [Apiotrichum porosum]